MKLTPTKSKKIDSRDVDALRTKVAAACAKTRLRLQDDIIGLIDTIDSNRGPSPTATELKSDLEQMVWAVREIETTLKGQTETP